jgi:uncharacterized Zn finger protein
VVLPTVCPACGGEFVIVHEIDRNPLTPNPYPDELRCASCGTTVPDNVEGALQR